MSALTPRPIPVPTKEELESTVINFQSEWGIVDEVLYGLCRDVPGHGSSSAVAAKVALIERAYAAGLERQVKFDRDKGEQPIVIAGRHVFQHGREVDEILDRLSAVREPLNDGSMEIIVEEHGRFTNLMKLATRGQSLSPRSFASKYLHFHRPVVPIYDEYARQRLTRLVRRHDAGVPFDRSPEGDVDYWDYCVRFLRLYEACSTTGIQVSVKKLDAYLWAIPYRGA